MRTTFSILFICLLIGHSSFGATIPTNRWSNAGVVGGIPSYSQYTNAVTAGCDNTGVSDCSAILQALVDSCPANQYVYLPAGTYKVDSTMNGPYWSSKALIGAGMGKTILNLNGGAYFRIGADDYPIPSPSASIKSGNLAGSTNLFLDTINAVSASHLVTITQTNPTWVHYNTNYYGNGPNSGHDKERLMAFTTLALLVTNSAKTNIIIADPLPIDFTNLPMVTAWNEFFCSAFGIENLTINATNSSASKVIFFDQVGGDWIRNVEVEYAGSAFTSFYESTHCSVVGCYFHDARGGGPNTEGLDLVENDCYFLVENNIFNASGFPQVMLGDYGGGCDCNVIAYNYFTNALSGQSGIGAAIGVNHGPHNTLNLVEGNNAQNLTSDGYYGSISHCTLFRNQISGAFASGYYDNFALGLAHWSRWFVLVGNVLGSAPITGMTVPTSMYANNGGIYSAGYPALGNDFYGGVADNPTDAGFFDIGVTNTWLNTGNYNYVTATTVWDGTGVQTIPASLYLAGQPSWWSNSVPFPPIGSDLTPMVSAIPAQLRYAAMGQTNSGATWNVGALNVTGTLRIGQ